MIDRRIGLQDHKSSNLFLRCLWSELRRRFGAMGWQYTPAKYGKSNRISFGWATLGSTSRSKVEIGIRYKQKGVINSMYFSPEGAGTDIDPKFDTLVNEAVDAALVGYATPLEFQRSMRVTSIPNVPFAHYQGTKWYVRPLEDRSTEVGMAIRAFDETDMDYELKYRSMILLNMLAAWTNCTLTIDNSCQPNALAAPRGEPWKDTDWIDDCPIVEGLIQLEANQIHYGDLIVQGPIDSKHKISRAAHHFAEGLRFFRGSSPSFYKIATVHLVSSLEVLSLLEDEATPVCTECKQIIFRISKRVVDYGIERIGFGAEHILKTAYAKRSRYLHTGGSDFSQPITLKTIPMLDPSAPEGCAMPEVIEYPNNLMEFTSFAIRAEVRDYIKLLAA